VANGEGPIWHNLESIVIEVQEWMMYCQRRDGGPLTIHHFFKIQQVDMDSQLGRIKDITIRILISSLVEQGGLVQNILYALDINFYAYLILKL